MKLSTAIKKASDANQLAVKLMTPFDARLAELLEDECAHFCYQASDGMVIAWDGGSANSSTNFICDIDSILTLTKKELLKKLDLAAI
jgi:hypothetical protein